MKKLFVAAMSIAMAAFMASCDKEEEVTGKLYQNNEWNAVLLNAGKSKNNNSNLRFFTESKQAPVLKNLFGDNNQMDLGDTGESITADNNHLFVAMYGSNRIYKLDEKGKIVKTVALRSPRFMKIYNNHLYVTKYVGEVTQLSLDLDSITSVKAGLHLESIAEANGKLYVSNSTDANWASSTDLFVIDPQQMKVSETLKTQPNPNQVISANGNIYLIAWNDFATYYVQKLDVNTHTFTTIGNATVFSAYGNKLYMVNSMTDWKTRTTKNEFLYYDMHTNELVKTNYLKSANFPQELNTTSIYSMEVNPRTGMFYFSTSDYKNNGNIYCFDKDGNYLYKFDAEGLNPKQILFL